MEQIKLYDEDLELLKKIKHIIADTDPSNIKVEISLLDDDTWSAWSEYGKRLKNGQNNLDE